MATNAIGQRIDIAPATSVVGAYISGVDLREPLDAETVTEISNALDRWKVLFFRDQRITAEHHLAFGRYFGDLTPAHPIERGDEHLPELYVVESKAAREQYGHTKERPRY